VAPWFPALLVASAKPAQGRAIGIDMTDAQLAKARALAAEAGVTNADFRAGYVERPPVEDGTVDCVISNGVINLSPDKPAVFAAAARALRPGGRLALSDIVTAVQLPAGVICDAALWAACIRPALLAHDLLLMGCAASHVSSSPSSRPGRCAASR
jgi:arsenite methyltransferase